MITEGDLNSNTETENNYSYRSEAHLNPKNDIFDSEAYSPLNINNLSLNDNRLNRNKNICNSRFVD